MKFDTVGNGMEESGRVGLKEVKPCWKRRADAFIKVLVYISKIQRIENT
jgi:hypothetical protein